MWQGTLHSWSTAKVLTWASWDRYPYFLRSAAVQEHPQEGVGGLWGGPPPPPARLLRSGVPPLLVAAAVPGLSTSACPRPLRRCRTGLSPAADQDLDGSSLRPAAVHRPWGVPVRTQHHTPRTLGYTPPHDVHYPPVPSPPGGRCLEG